MILVLAYWLFLFAFFLPAGVLLKKMLRLQTQNLPITLLLGMLISTVTFSLTAFFFPLGWAALAIHICIFAVAIVQYKTEIRTLLSTFWNGITSLSIFHKTLLLFLITGAALKSAQPPFIIDNESYYIQTIKWLNEYGFVKGLGNLHIFFAQSSPWHVLQAGLNFSFITNRINDINGFVFITCLCFYIIEGKKRLKEHNFHWISFLPVFSVLLFLFIDAPSPDLPLLMIVPIIIYLYAETTSENDKFRTALVLFVFLTFIKVTIAPVGLLFLFWPSIKKNARFMICTGLFAASIWIAKNLILTGYPFYPFLILSPGFEWTIPETILRGIHKTSNQSVYHANVFTPIPQKLLNWLTIDGFDGIMNKLAVVLFLLLPVFKKIRTERKLQTIYFCFLLHFLILLFISPQFRFFLPEIIIFTSMLLALLCSYTKNANACKVIIGLTTICTLILFVNIPFSTLTDNKFHQNTSSFALRQLYLPEPNTRFSQMEFVKQKEGQLNYYSPKENFFLFGTADGPLPCVNRAQVEYLEKRFRYIPQPLGKDLRDGFYSAPVKVE